MSLKDVDTALFAAFIRFTVYELKRVGREAQLAALADAVREVVALAPSRSRRASLQPASDQGRESRYRKERFGRAGSAYPMT
ncbi:hypothetical protein [Streptomyces tibetensis]|uniref:hypothetical protein n=1 Tax=Streptomyces tibetensis TaxID=2382123 RepID=UPI0033E1FC4C